MSDIDYVSGVQYADGKDPVDWAVELVSMLLTARGVGVWRAENGRPPLDAWIDLSHEAVGRKIVAALMNAGWQPPEIAGASGNTSSELATS